MTINLAYFLEAINLHARATGNVTICLLLVLAFHSPFLGSPCSSNIYGAAVIRVEITQSPKSGVLTLPHLYCIRHTQSCRININ